MVGRSERVRTTRVPVIQLYNDRLAHAFDLGRRCRHKNRNVDGSSLIMLHELFADVNENVEGYIDLFVAQALPSGSIVNPRKRFVSTLSHFLEMTCFGSSQAIMSVTPVSPSRHLWN